MTGAPAGSRLSALPAYQVLFGKVQIAEPAERVVRRIRSAIGLGLLPDGDRLPKEADLAEQLGVTIFTLREALSQLRDEGLIETRSGAKGGSFVRIPGEAQELASEELIRFSSSDLRDLGDWRRMVTSSSAYLAADRATASNISRLYLYVDELIKAETLIEARRAHGRFHIELAAAAQSVRMTRAEFYLHEELDWLFGIVLAEQQRRTATAVSLRAIADAVAARQPEAARAAAENHAQDVLEDLLRHRLALIAKEQPEWTSKAKNLGDAVEELVGTLLAQLEAVASKSGPLLADPRTSADQLQVAISASVVEAFAQVEVPVHGMGVLAEVELVTGSPYWMVWWRKDTTGLHVDTHHVLDPEREDFYDYAQGEVYTSTKRTLQPFASGPYIDYGGVDDYTLTLSVPIMKDGQFVGVAAVDMLVSDLERWFAPWLAAEKGATALLNSDDRVIISNLVTSHTVKMPKKGSSKRRALKLLEWAVVSINADGR